jgi:hypothetical protein
MPIRIPTAEIMTDALALKASCSISESEKKSEVPCATRSN